MRILGLAVIALVSFAGRSEASCKSVSLCFCPPALTHIRILVTESIDGGTSAVRVESSEYGLTVDAGLSFPVSGSETVGSRWLLLNDERRPVDASGNVSCPDFAGPPIAVEFAASAAVSPTCGEQIADAGYEQPPCRDVQGCSTAPLALFPLLALGWLFRRRSS